MRPWRLVFAGTPDFACPSLQALTEAGQEILLVISQPDRPSGRGQQLKPPPIKEAALRLGMPVEQPEQIDTPDMRRRLLELSPDAVVVVAYGQKIPSWLLSLPPLGCLNVHASLLPRYRGAAPIQRAILNGDAETGVTIMRLDEGWDTGPMLRQSRVAILPEDDAGTLHERLAVSGASLLRAALAGLAEGTVLAVAQDEALATKAPKIRPEEMRLNWHEPAVRLRNLVRALAPAPLAETFHAGRRLQIMRAEAIESAREAVPGTVLEVDRDGLLVQTGSGALLLLEVKPANGRPMPAAAYAHGHHLLPGGQLE